MIIQKFFSRGKSSSAFPPVWLSIIPVVALLGALITIIVTLGAAEVQTYSYLILLAAAALAFGLRLAWRPMQGRMLRAGVAKSARQILPAVPILLLIGTLSSTWMLSGVVPLLIDYGLELLNPSTFLMLACVVCAAVSVVTGTSWTTIATIGVALMGIGTVMGYNPAWVAGAIISGAYFGDKVSPLSDTTVLAASSTGVELFSHIRFLMITTIPAMTIALIVYGVVGFTTSTISVAQSEEITRALAEVFNLSPWVLTIPLLTGVMIALRLRTDLTLAISSVAGLAGLFIFQPGVVERLGGVTFVSDFSLSMQVLFTSTGLTTGHTLLDSLVGTGGVEGMLPTVWLVLSAMTFGGVMLATGMLQSLTRSFTHHLHNPRRLVGATVASGLFLNSCTGDQYLSIILGSNMYKSSYKRARMRPQVLSRSLEDSISVTSVLIPWNSCGVTQSTVLGVATLAYLPCCVFNYLSPVMTLIVAWIGWRVKASRPQLADSDAAAICPGA